MPRVKQPKGTKGSLKWIQKLVNEKPELIDAELKPALLLSRKHPIGWVSPLRNDNHAEYSDGASLDRLGIGQLAGALSGFWPKRGPQWDALATFERTGRKGVLLVEAKAHVAEMLSPPCQAREKSRKKIEAALAATQRYFNAKPGCDWTKRFYQYANRLAHLYFLREVNGIDAYLVFIYFLNDPDLNGPSSAREWHAAITVMHEALGVRGRLPGKNVVDVFVDVRELS